MHAIGIQGCGVAPHGMMRLAARCAWLRPVGHDRAKFGHVRADGYPIASGCDGCR